MFFENIIEVPISTPSQSKYLQQDFNNPINNILKFNPQWYSIYNKNTISKHHIIHIQNPQTKMTSQQSNENIIIHTTLIPL